MSSNPDDEKKLEMLRPETPVFSYSETTRNLRVSVVPEYLDDQSDPQRDIYAFAYTVTIENHGLDTVQLMKRHWVVMSGGTLYTEVSGDGVVGEQPTLASGEVFTYTSSSMIKDPVGSMHGEYIFRTEEDKEFEVNIPQFDLVYPEAVH